MGYCFFYDDVEVINIGLVWEIKVKVDEVGVIILFNIKWGVFV